MEKKELIQKFLNNKCSGEEEVLVQQLLETEPHLLDEFLNQTEWEAAADSEIKHDSGLKTVIWQQVHAALRGRIISGRFFKSVAVAASILLLALSGYYFFSNRQAGHLSSAPSSALLDAAHTKRNRSGKMEQLHLPDGSVVTLYPGAAIQYNADFTRNRILKLTSGKAAFEVAKDPAHPFTVFSGNIMTTALGTKFIVDQSGGKVNVRLYEGKVVVKHINQNTMLPPTYLLAGEQCIVNSGMDGVTVTTLNNEQFADVIKSPVPAIVKEAPGAAVGNLKFYNVPLNEAFDELEKMFNRSIAYNTGEVSGKYFTGQFSARDSFEQILNILTVVNGLSARKAQGVINITQTADSIAGIAKPAPEKKTHTVPEKEILRFTNAPLNEVFSDMEKMFGVTIRFDETDISNKYFTGQIAAGDNVKTMLSIICRMNQLQMKENGQEYRIVK